MCFVQSVRNTTFILVLEKSLKCLAEVNLITCLELILYWQGGLFNIPCIFKRSR